MVNYHHCWILIVLCKNSRKTCVESWVQFFCSTLLSTQVQSPTSKSVATWVPMSYWGLGLGVPCEVVSPNFSYSQWLRLHGLTSSDLGPRVKQPLLKPPQGLHTSMRSFALYGTNCFLKLYDVKLDQKQQSDFLPLEKITKKDGKGHRSNKGFAGQCQLHIKCNVRKLCCRQQINPYSSSPVI